MKRVLLLIISVLMISTTITSAQDTWKPKTPTAEMKFRMGQASISRQGYFYILSSHTDFTLMTEVWTMVLGNGREEALETINKLIHISNLNGGIYPYKDTDFGVYDKYLKIERKKGEIYYGEAFLYDSELKKAKQFIEKGK